MPFDLEDIQSNYPFLTLIKVGKEEYLGIVQNCDQRLISLYNYAVMPQEAKAIFLEYGRAWWWESNRKLPINIFIGSDFEMLVSSTLHLIFHSMACSVDIFWQDV